MANKAAILGSVLVGVGFILLPFISINLLGYSNSMTGINMAMEAMRNSSAMPGLLPLLLWGPAISVILSLLSLHRSENQQSNVGGAIQIMAGLAAWAPLLGLAISIGSISNQMDPLMRPIGMGAGETMWDLLLRSLGIGFWAIMAGGGLQFWSAQLLLNDYKSRGSGR